MNSTTKPINVHSLNWRAVVTVAQLQRVQRPPADAETITVERSTYDAIVAIAQFVAGLQDYGNPNRELEIHKTPDGFQVTLRDNLIGELTETKSNLFDALREAQFRRSQKIQRMIE